MSNLQTRWTSKELLANHQFAAPLYAGGVLCHGGFDDDGNYVSPRTRFRTAAIEAWQKKHRQELGTELLDMPLDTWPEHYPNVEQAKYLIGEGVRAPLVTTLTRVGTVEGFGAVLRGSSVPDLPKLFDDDIKGTALEHLATGLFEAHGRDEAGFEEEAGHKDMWFATRDIAFERPLTPEQEQAIVERVVLGAAPQVQKAISGSGGGDGAQRSILDDIDPALLGVAQRMIRILLIEIQAFHTFAWAEAVLSDIDLVAGEGEAARIVSFIRQDETPHVEYLRTALTEMRDRTLIGNSGRKYPGIEVVGKIWDAAVAASLLPQTHDMMLGELDLALEANPRKGQILEGFHALGSVVPTAAGAGAGPTTTY